MIVSCEASLSGIGSLVQSAYLTSSQYSLKLTETDIRGKRG